MLEFKFDIICLSESKIQKNCEPKIYINIDGYQSPVGTPTESAKGGVLIYDKNYINFKFTGRNLSEFYFQRYKLCQI